MTNRERIMAELAALGNEGFYDALSDNTTCMAMENRQCRDCKAEHGGICPALGDDDKCPITTEAWMDAQWRGEPILVWVSV